VRHRLLPRNARHRDLPADLPGANCGNCRSGVSQCDSCITGYDLTNSSACTASFCFIDFCATCGSLTTCSACITGFSLQTGNTSCQSDCETNHSNCLFCSSSACTTCKKGYQVSSGNCILICAAITNCIFCETATICAGCAAGYELAANQLTCGLVCKVYGCQVCASATASTCTSCMTGYSLAANNTLCTLDCGVGYVNTGSGGVISCQLCSSNVAFCDSCLYTGSAIQCLTCAAGYFINGLNCELCSGAITNCLTCISSTVCDSCATGFTLVNYQCVNGSGCATGITNCYACSTTNSSQCVTCAPGYSIVAGAGTCQVISCATSFVANVTSGACVCPTGTYNLNSVCTACADPHCVSCSAILCTVCADRFYSASGVCVSCIANCLTCRSASSCSLCAEGFSRDSTGACSFFGGGNPVAITSSGAVVKCPAGCSVCVAGSASSTQVLCILAKDGYSIVAGLLTRCSTSCKACDSLSSSTCTACYPRFALVSGACTACGDANALTCSSLNVNYSLTCSPGYTSVYNSSSGSNGGTCQACAANCLECDQSGAGNCDDGGCRGGAVKLYGTTNCSLCFSGCEQCSIYNPGTCTDCGLRRFLDANSSLCVRCNAGCINCTVNASNCQACDFGYALVGTNCTAIPSNCIALNSSGLCTGCLAGYALNAASTACAADIACNATDTCTVCPDGFYFQSNNSRCFQCNTQGNCVACSSSNSGTCTGCATGTFLDSTGTCSSCATTCLSCESFTFCTRAIDTYYTVLNAAGTPTGAVAQCLPPCSTCSKQATLCLSCVAGYTLSGTECQINVYLDINIIFAAAGVNPIFSNNSSNATQLFSALKEYNRIGNGLFQILKSSFNWAGTDFRTFIRFTKLFSASVGATMTADSGSFSNGAAATNAFNSAVPAGTTVDGVSVVSSSTTANGYSSSSGDDSTNLGLILGLSIPLSILRTSFFI
jgi:hypothetical protein